LILAGRGLSNEDHQGGVGADTTMLLDPIFVELDIMIFIARRFRTRHCEVDDASTATFYYNKNYIPESLVFEPATQSSY
jgi:hypothetical protein